MITNVNITFKCWYIYRYKIFLVEMTYKKFNTRRLHLNIKKPLNLSGFFLCLTLHGKMGSKLFCFVLF